MRSIAYYVERYLPASQAFVAQQGKALSRYKARILAGSRVESPSAHIADFQVDNLSSSRRWRAGELALKLARLPVPALWPKLDDVDLFHAHFGKNGYVISPLAKRLGKPLVTTFHGFDATYAGDPKTPGGFNQVRYFRQGRAEMAQSGSWAIAVSDFIEQKLLALGFSPERIRRHYIGIDTSVFKPDATAREPYRVVSVARFVEYKGHRHMIDALARVAKGGIPVEFVMVGQGPLRGQMESHARAHLPVVKVFDSLAQHEIAQLLRSARVYLHGSVTLSNGHAEAFGLANLEAQAAGTPVVAFDSGGVGEALIAGESGYLAAERDETAMADAVAKLLTNQDLWQSFSTKAAQSAREHFDIALQTPGLEAIYDEVLRSHAGARS